MKRESIPMDESDLAADALTVAQVLRDLGPREREEITTAAFESALQALPEVDRMAVQRTAGKLSGRVRGIGNRTALATPLGVGAIGVLWAGQP
jgi:hypothetical protein